MSVQLIFSMWSSGNFVGPAHRCSAGGRVHRDTASIIRCNQLVCMDKHTYQASCPHHHQYHCGKNITGGRIKTKMHRKARDAKERGDTYCDQSHATNIERVDCQEQWNARLSSPTFALSEALRKVETWEVADSSAGGSRS